MQKSLISPGLFRFTISFGGEVTKSWFKLGSIKAGDAVNAKAYMSFSVITTTDLALTQYPHKTLGDIEALLRSQTESLNNTFTCSGYYFCLNGQTSYKINLHTIDLNYAGISSIYIYGTDETGNVISGTIPEGADIKISGYLGPAAYTAYIIRPTFTL